jgi:hypothetical protein
MIGSIPTCDLTFHPAQPGAMVMDPRTGKLMHLDGYWKTQAGRTIRIALSLPGSVLRMPSEVPE